ncbi:MULTISPECIES: protein translocase subunit SecD [Ralstonia solanacearum species complex]|uniref:Protein translocase subunit SecD n=2 Tax=Ralstonia solanacearum TaxID=305 RepID=A0ABF7RFA1_RALSL|nr:protein translocase subunit SecD [Ralstonia solanacearum]ALF87126.1 preprotein translocase subunit SecD [Ralstonia solanacearum]EAP73637.1 Protein translocase subunit secD [Ralstonia solanacearum UW551]KEI31798.1 preprotein translocase subunit SecD [Ralstonia solanacearum]KFX80441.1 preprotein translocase subunit SecD [Ralstonia solanacearum]KFX83395.1 preprotein translocase subunit SecD [Ralstonia solanacearum]
MNRYPLWKYLVILVALAIGFLYTLPNFFGEAPAVQVSSGKATVRVDLATQKQVEDLLAAANLTPNGVFFDQNGTSGSVRVRFADTDTQLKAKDVLARGLNSDPSDPTHIVALNLLSGSPRWLTAIHALPMFLGLDLRGGVHFLLQVDMNGALTKKLDSLAGDIRTQLRDKGVRHNGIERSGTTISIKFSNPDEADRARGLLADSTRELAFATDKTADGVTLTGTFTAAAMKEVQDNAVKQNVVTLHNRVNELGVSEPVIQQQGPDRIVVQLPGVQDTAKAKDIIGRTATLEARMADPNATGIPRLTDPVPLGDELFTQGRGAPVLLQKQVIFTGDRINSASAGFDQNHNPSVDITLDGQGGRMLRDISRDNIGKRMAIVLFEKGKGEVLTVATIQSELGSRFQITGIGSVESASDLALLLRAGSLAAPMEIIEERTIGPSLGADNIKKGFDSAAYGFAAISVFMVLYYMLFGAFSVVSLGVNVFLLIAILSMLQATLTLPGIAAIALALGMAIDANVLINERIREELRNGASPQMAIAAGFERAWATILDSNVTTLIAGLALLAFGSGPVRGFAVVHCLGILTSMFSAVFFNRSLVNLWYGRKKKLQGLAIGQVWKPAGTAESPAKQ